MAQQQAQKKKSQVKGTHIEDSNVDVTNPELAEKTDATLDSIDDVLEDQLDTELLDFMDEVMGTEEEAREIVDNFINQGGQ